MKLMRLAMVWLAAAALWAAAAAAQTREITFMQWMYQPTDPVLLTFTEAFEGSHPGARLNHIVVPRWELTERTLTMIAGGVPIDVVWQDAAITNTFYLQGILEDLNPYLERDGIDRADYPPAGWEESTYGGGLYAFPSTMGTYLLFYNRDHLDRAGVAPPSNDWDREGFLQTVRGLIDPEGHVYAYENRNWVTTFLPWLWAEGGDWFNEDRTASALDTPVAIRAQQFLVDLIHVYGVSPPYPTPDDVTFEGRRISMLHGSTWEVPEPGSDFWPFPWGAVLPPRGPQGQYTVVQTNGLAIISDSQRKEDAWEFVKWFNGEEGQTILAQHGEFPAYLPVARRMSFTHLDEPLRRTIFEAVNIGRAFPVNPAWEDSLAIAWQRQGEALAGESAASAALEQAATEINGVIQALLQSLD